LFSELFSAVVLDPKIFWPEAVSPKALLLLSGDPIGLGLVDPVGLVDPIGLVDRIGLEFRFRLNTPPPVVADFTLFPNAPDLFSTFGTLFSTFAI
jgi:hypothetical protein